MFFAGIIYLTAGLFYVLSAVYARISLASFAFTVCSFAFIPTVTRLWSEWVALMFFTEKNGQEHHQCANVGALT